MSDTPGARLAVPLRTRWPSAGPMCRQIVPMLPLCGEVVGEDSLGEFSGLNKIQGHLHY